MSFENTEQSPGIVLALAQVAVYILSFLAIVILCVVFRAFVTRGVSWYLSAGCFAAGVLVAILVANLRQAVANKNRKRAAWSLAVAAIVVLVPALYVMAGMANLMFSDERRYDEQQAREKQFAAARPLFESCQYATSGRFDSFAFERRASGGYLRGKVFLMAGEPAAMVDSFFSLPEELRATRPEEISTLIILYGDARNPKHFSDGSLGIGVRILDRTLNTEVLDDVVEVPPATSFANEDERTAYVKQNETKLISYLSGLSRK